VPIAGLVLLFLGGTALHLFSTTSFGIFLGTIARSMPQFGLLMILFILPVRMLSSIDAARAHARHRASRHAGHAHDALGQVRAGVAPALPQLGDPDPRVSDITGPLDERQTGCYR